MITHRVLFYVIVAFFLSLGLTNLTLIFTRRWHILDHPDERKIHTFPIPRGGGVSFVLTWVIIAYLATFLTGLVQEFLQPALAIAIGATLILIIGVWDDVKEISLLPKLGAQLIAASLLLLTFPLDLPLPALLIILLAFLWIVGLSNAFNLIDGLDGLAAGLGIIASASFVILGLLQSQPLVVAFSAILATSCLGFLPYNWHPAKIFMGDAGSMFLGFVLAAISLLAIQKIARPIEILIPVFFLAVPIFDTLLSIIRRTLQRKSIFKPDKAHFYNLLMNRGFSHRGAVIFSYGLAIFLSICGIFFKFLSVLFWGWGILIFAFIVMVLLVFKFRLIAEE